MNFLNKNSKKCVTLTDSEEGILRLLITKANH